ncbi:hypothetical protein [Mycobacterium sp. URHB0044]|jgi:hypothetical protein|uniref:hypothetical protein n=1 Tax=Mycobacterium sp. URHB0044 TaxID=1380386 RepID=UPI00048B644C|nr:hypothetical protein [Mycobacterium sp. URHB0044]
MDEFRGAAHMIDVEPLLRPVGHVWPWVVAALGVLIIVTGGILLSPDAGVSSSGPAAISSE